MFSEYEKEYFIICFILKNIFVSGKLRCVETFFHKTFFFQNLCQVLKICYFISLSAISYFEKRKNALVESFKNDKIV